jgi:hypothetical protein
VRTMLQDRYLWVHIVLSPVRHLLINGTKGVECQYVVKQKPGIKAGAVDNLNRRLGKTL